jgi:hypothetical protein
MIAPANAPDALIPLPLEMGVLERSLESRLVRQAKAAGGVAIKWTSPSTAGVMDRIVFLPGGRVMFVEVKAPGKRLSPLQARLAVMLTALGADVRCVDSVEAVDAIFT